jgi:hypothetical protein
MGLNEDRKKIVEKIEQYEREEKWDVDVEDDPPAPQLLPNKVDYLNKKLSSKFGTWIANKVAVKYFDKEIKQGRLIIDKVVGMENYDKVADLGVVITCNHFNVYDNYVVFKALQKKLGKKRLYKVIREGNFTNFPGIFGYMFKHCNTLPLSSNYETMKLFMNATKTLLNRGEKILIYPEQAMWWNYKKPRPLKSGAFKIAVSAGAPILPCFITMTDSDKESPDGSMYQRYTLHILPAIFPDKTKPAKEQSQELSMQNYEMWKIVYEKTYGIKLEYAKKGD